MPRANGLGAVLAACPGAAVPERMPCRDCGGAGFVLLKDNRVMVWCYRLGAVVWRSESGWELSCGRGGGAAVTFVMPERLYRAFSRANRERGLSEAESLNKLVRDYVGNL